jgi:hypothetical protein
MRSRWRGGKRTQTFGACRPGRVRVGGVLSGERTTRDLQGRGCLQRRGVSHGSKPARSALPDGDRPTVQRLGVNPKRLVLLLSIRTELPNSGLQLTRAPERLC